MTETKEEFYIRKYTETKIDGSIPEPLYLKSLSIRLGDTWKPKWTWSVDEAKAFDTVDEAQEFIQDHLRIVHGEDISIVMKNERSVRVYSI